MPIAADLRNDLEALDRLWSDDLIMSSSENLIFTKAQVLVFFQSGLIKLEKLERMISKSIAKGNAVFLIGNQQLVSKFGSGAMGTEAGALVLSSFMAGWVSEDGVWKLGAWIRRQNREPLRIRSLIPQLLFDSFATAASIAVSRVSRSTGF
jgi:hypothetical protein